MALYRLTLAYDGTDFAGWQRQASLAAARTVQGVLEAALQRVTGAAASVAGAGRTDAGVHALGQVASFELPRAPDPERLQRALNGVLPEDVRVLCAAWAPAGFHARKSALRKHYRYVLDTGPVQDPLRRRQAGHVRAALDPAAVHEVAQLFLGRQDFASLQSAGGSVKTTIRNVERSEARFSGSTLTYDVEADGFLRKMVRSMVGGLIAAGSGARSAQELREALLARDRRSWPAPAAARGLVLARVAYPGE